jgi:hypothetical protein
MARFPRVPFTRVLVVLALAVAAAVATTTPAHADVVSLTCTGDATLTFSPGLTNTTQSVTATLDASLGAAAPLGACVNLGVSPVITSGDQPGGGSARDRSCTELNLGGTDGDTTIDWNGGQSSSTASFTSTATRGLSTTQLIWSGEVTSGQFDGAAFVETYTLLNPNLLQCLTPAGVTQVTGIVVVEIVSL